MKRQIDIKWDFKKVMIKGANSSDPKFERATLNLDTGDMRTVLKRHNYIENYPTPGNPIKPEMQDHDVFALLGKMSIDPNHFIYIMDFCTAREEEKFKQIEAQKEKVAEMLERGFESATISMKVSHVEESKKGLPDELKALPAKVLQFSSRKEKLGATIKAFVAAMETIPQHSKGIESFQAFQTFQAATKEGKKPQQPQMDKESMIQFINFKKRLSELGAEIVSVITEFETTGQELQALRELENEG